MIYCLDTDVIMSVMRKKTEVIDVLRTKSVEDLFVSEVVRSELYLGCLKSDHPT